MPASGDRMSELTLTVFRLGLVVLLWFFVFSVVGVLRTDLYGTRVSRRSHHAALVLVVLARVQHVVFSAVLVLQHNV